MRDTLVGGINAVLKRTTNPDAAERWKTTREVYRDK